VNPFEDEVVKCIEELSDLLPPQSPGGSGSRLASGIVVYVKPQVAVCDTANRLSSNAPRRARPLCPFPQDFSPSIASRDMGFTGQDHYVTQELARLRSGL